MDPGMSERCSLVRAFVEFELLPDLLARTPVSGADSARLRRGSSGYAPPDALDETVALGRWADFLAEAGANVDHVEEGDLPDEPLDEMLAADAWELAKRLDLVSLQGVTRAGARIAAVAERPWDGRTVADHRTVVRVVADGVRQHYVGDDGIEIVPLLVEAARSLGATDHPWARLCPGLLLVEFEALLHWGFRQADRARLLAGQLVEHRDIAMHSYGPPPRGADRAEIQLLHADATADFYWRTPELAGATELTITELRSTAMLLTFAGILEESYLAPVSCLSPPRAGDETRA